MKCPRREAGDDRGGPDEFVLLGPGELARCSYCGSVSGDDFMAYAQAGGEVTPTDKRYKAYLSGGAKVYFQHLSEEQRQRFVELLNEGKMKVGYPGHFYALPFFCRAQGG